LRLRITLLALSGLGILFAQTTPPSATDIALEDPSVLRAKINLAKVRGMVESGTLPRVRLEAAEEKLADAIDEATYTRAIYGKDLSAEQAAETVNATRRRVERRKKTADEQEKLLAQGIISQSELRMATDDVQRVQREYDWAVAREKLVAEVANFAAAEMALMKQMEEGSSSTQISPGGMIERFVGKNEFTTTDFSKVQAAYTARFSHGLPISANGETAVHRSMGFDHAGRIDVALYPDSAEGQWLRRFLTANRIPFFAFRGAVAGQATGAHIHMGPPSTHYVQAKASSTVSGPGN